MNEAPITFYKYQSSGNDFIIIDDRELFFPHDDPCLIAELCDRRFGIGADGLMLLRSSDLCDFEMAYFNADGREGSFCGNGGRSIDRFAFDNDLIDTHTKFLAIDGEHETIVSDGTRSIRF